MHATITYTDERDGHELIAVNGHELQFGGGNGGDGFCYAHQSFDCLDALSQPEWVAVRNAVPADEVEAESGR